MPSQRRWRQRLLGNLQGQLQLATYHVVFAGFTGASTAGLWVGNSYQKGVNIFQMSLFSFSTAMKASCGTSTLPIAFIRFLPLACFFSSFFFLEISPP